MSSASAAPAAAAAPAPASSAAAAPAPAAAGAPAAAAPAPAVAAAAKPAPVPAPQPAPAVAAKPVAAPVAKQSAPVASGVGCCGPKKSTVPAGAKPTGPPAVGGPATVVSATPSTGCAPRLASPSVASGLYIVDSSTMPQTLAAYLSAIVTDVVARRGVVHVAVSGGSLPPLLGRALEFAFKNRMDLHTQNWVVWYADERLIPHKSEREHAADREAIERAVKEAAELGRPMPDLMSVVKAPETNHSAMTREVYRHPSWRRGGDAQVQVVNTTIDPKHAAAEYEQRLSALMASARGASVPRMDVVLLGMGEDGHTASLFPPVLWSPAPATPEEAAAVPAENIFRRNLDLDITRDPFRTELETRRHLALTGRGPSSVRVPLVAPVVFSPKPPSNRITMTLSLLNASNNIGVFVQGGSKAPAAARALEQVSARFSSRNRGAPLPKEVIDGHLPAALLGSMDNSWPAAYFLDAAAASGIAPPEAPRVGALAGAGAAGAARPGTTTAGTVVGAAPAVAGAGAGAGAGAYPAVPASAAGAGAGAAAAAPAPAAAPVKAAL